MAPVPYELGNEFNAFPLASQNEVINEEIDWSSYLNSDSNSYGSVISMIAGGWFDDFFLFGEWPSTPRRLRATFVKVPEVTWLGGNAGVIEVPIETDGRVFTQPSAESDFVSPEIVQEWTTDVTKLSLGGVDYNVYAQIIPSNTTFTDVSVDAHGHVYVPSVVRSRMFLGNATSTQPDSIYYRIDTEGLGQQFTAAQMPAVTIHRVAASIVETTQRLVSTKLLLHVSTHNAQQIRVKDLRFNISHYYFSQNSETEAILSVYQMGSSSAYGVTVDQLGDVLPVSGEIVPWQPSMAGSYVGTLVAGSEFTPRAPNGYGVIQSLTIGQTGSYSGVIKVRGHKPLRLRGKFSAAEASSVSVETNKGRLPYRGARLAFMRMPEGTVSLVASCHFGSGNDYYAIGEKVLASSSPLLGKHTLVMPNDQTSNGITADATGLMTIAKNSTVKILFRFPSGAAISLSTKVSSQGMIPIYYDAGEHSLIGRLRHVDDHALGDWTGGLYYSDWRSDDNTKYLTGTCVGHPFRGWNPLPSSVMIHLEDQNGEVTSIEGSYATGMVRATDIELRVNSDGFVRGQLLTPTGKKSAITGVALSSQDIWTCASNAEGMKKITVTGIPR